MPPNRSRNRHLAMPAMAALALSLSIAEAQERSPYYIGLSQTVSHDNNIFRATRPVSETIYSTGVVAGFDQPIGRQRFYGDASAQVNRFRKLDQLDNKSFAVTAGLDWETIQFLSGQLRYSTRNSLADFGALEGATLPSDQVTQQAVATARYGISSRWALDGGYEYRSLKFRNPAYQSREFFQDAVHAGLTWGTSDLLTVGLSYRMTNGSTPHFQVAPPYEDELKRRDIDLTVAWSPTAFSTLRARMSATNETHSLSRAAELDAVTGALSWDYRPTAKLTFTTSLIRDTGTETTFLAATGGTGSAALPISSNRLTNRGQLDAAYAITSKISLRGDVGQTKGTLSSGAGEEKVRNQGIGVSYIPTRGTSLSCSVMRESRDVQGSSAYSATTSGCTAQITLR